MKLSSPAQALLRNLSATWSSSQDILVVDGEITVRACHPLGGEVFALVEGTTASLPFYPRGDGPVAWVTIAPNAETLQAAIADLRAWIIPSFGWDEPRGAIVTPSAPGAGEIADALAALAPAGYFRWRMRRAHESVVLNQLNAMRKLLMLRPRHAADRVPSLLEMRQQFDTASAAGNQDAAEAAIAAIDKYQLDSASNTAFMRILLAERFGNEAAIVGRDETRRLLSLRVPSRVRGVILHAYHRVLLKEAEDLGHFGAAAEIYEKRTESDVGGWVAIARASDSLVVARLRGYRALMMGDKKVAAEVFNAAPGDPVSSLLRPLLATQQLARDTELELTLEQQFYHARLQADWQSVQSIGGELLQQTREHIPVLRKSLDFSPNAALAARLDELEAQGPATPVRAVPPATPATWLQWLQRLQLRDWASANRFVDELHPPISEITAAEIEQMSFMLEELYTGDDLKHGTPLERALLSGLAAMIQEFTSDESFPNPTLGHLYDQFLLIWAHVRRGSLIRVDGQLLLSLADAVIRANPAAAGEAVEQVQRWWEVKPVRALLPFALEAVDLLLDVTTDRETASMIWYAAAGVARQNQQALSSTERTLLRYLAQRLVINDEVVNGYVQPEPEELESDSLRRVGLKKIAILHSWAPDAARRAEEMLRQRTGAEVVIVCAEEKTPTVKAAGNNNDVVLFLPRRSSHQLYYGLSAARDKIVYVAGVTASSIVLALEQWAQKRGTP